MDRGLLVLASGTGTLAEAIIRASQDGELSAHILAVLTDKPEAEVVSKSYPAFWIDLKRIGVAIEEV